ncbi:MULTISPECIES: hypothetical protein [pseudomallei group]|uniref:hypothetical protein n=1 Tax=pseudomallei group TaxID=111527 RepID=UPI000318CD88|nr:MULTISPECIES: hypothetical protein [pseudomallei group]AIS97131.1 putative gp52 [Burkholderia thailandensis MSMB59]KGS44660.1 putative gp52 [Burkholderia pseudomallei MSHR5492]KGS46656.1 putative gp26 [Burkholderia pseudomallei MSHR5613]MCS6426429.1 hypothetical protein [Burkholderia thailandensis]MCS6465645.1 hypothetical protein [Burkholderia thailandensis]
MGKLVETSQWEEDLYQIETGDPVEGGPDGVSNKQAKQLGGRTRYLKQQVEQSQTSLAQHVAAPDPHSQYALKTDLAAKLAALVGQSPQSLDTLKELADALGNDPNFATTVLNGLSTKAPIDSSNLTGTPRAPTPPQFDNTTRLATTAFVLKALGSYSGVSVITKATTLTSAEVGQIIELNGNTSFTTTLPPGNAIPAGGRAVFVNQSGVNQTVATQGGDLIWSYAGGLISSVVLVPGDSLELFSRVGQWDIGGGTVALRHVQGATTQTPSQFDNTSKLATTAFVQRALGSFQAFSAYTSSQTLTASQSGSVINFWGGSASTFTLPSAAAMPGGGAFLLNNTSSSAPVTIVRAGNDTILANGGNTSVVLQPGDNLLIVPAGGTQWVAVGGSAQLPFAGTMSGANFVTAPQFDSSNKLATTAFAQRASGGVVGAVRNASMNVSAASASATFTADEIVVETTLGGGFFRLAGFNKTINLAATGAGGMDTGSAPTSGYVALYAIYNPALAAVALLATNATAGRVSEVYSGGNMPAGYTASALVSVWPTNGSGQFIQGVQVDRQLSIPFVTVLTTSSTQASPTALSISAAVPPNARKASGTMSVASTSSTPSTSLSVYAAVSGCGIQGINNSVGAAGGISTTYRDLPITVMQTLYYSATSTAGTPTFTMSVSGYEI